MTTDKNRVEEWFDAYAEDLFRWALAKLPSDDIAKDLVQDTFVAALQSVDKFKAVSSPRTWLIGILKNKIADYYRKESRIPTQSFEDSFAERTQASDDFNEQGHWKEMAATDTWNADVELLDNPEFLKVMNSCLNKLPNNWSLIIQAKYLLEKEAEEICKEFEISKTNYWQVIHRAKLAMRACIHLNWN